jgi:RNA polymerase sigma factor (sigma-70 family)
VGQWIEQVYDVHRQGLFSLALSIAGTPEDAEDAVHDAFARLCRSRTNGMADPVAYVFAAVRNAALDRLRNRRAIPETACPLFRSMACSAGEPMRTMLDQERDRQVQAAVESLAAEKREVVVMKIYGELTFAQIAAVLVEPLSTVATRYQKAMDEIRLLLERKLP